MACPSRTVAFLVGVMACCLALSAALMPGCSQDPTPPKTTQPDQIYTVRGKIVSLPDPAKPASQLTIRHEPIPSFVSKDGKVVGMNAMAMGFTPAPGLSLSEFAEGDVVEFTFEVRWTSSPAAQLTTMRKLPPDTPLDFGQVKPSGT